jgi:regulator of replication initiation timing
LLVKYNDWDAFRGDFAKKIENLNGKVITFKKDSNVAIVVSEHSYTELDIRKYNGFVGNLKRLIQENKDFKDQLPKLYQENTIYKDENKELSHKLKNRKKISDKELKQSAMFAATKFAAIVQACGSKEELLETIDTAAADIVELIYSFKDNEFSPKKFITEKDL